MYIYYCWITALLPNYQDAIIAGFVKKGYMVGPAAKDGVLSLTKENCPAVLIALSLYKAEGELTPMQIYDDVTQLLTEINAKYYSIVISLSHDASWGGPNFSIPLKKKAEPPPLPPGKKNEVN
jgi:hypothetical protein